MFAHLPIFALISIFAGSAAVIWVAGVKLADTTDILSSRLHLGKALGGILVLAIATNLPEIAIVASAAWTDHLGVAIGNILGGIAIQTVVLAAIDVAMEERVALTYRAASLTLVIEATIVVAVLIVTIMAAQFPASVIAARLTPGTVAIALIWVGGLWLTSRAADGLPWHDTTGSAPDAQPAPKGHSKGAKAGNADRRGVGTTTTVLVFAAAALATLVAGVTIEQSGDALAGRLGMTGVLFGATILAAATSLPELSTGITSVRMRDYQLAISDILGGNAFLPVLFLLAVLISGKAVLPAAQASDIYLAGLGILLTCVYTAGLIFRPQRQILRMGIDSFAVILLYALGMAGLFLVVRTPGG